MRILSCFICVLFGCILEAGAQAQNPGAQQDAQAAREKLLKASDQLENIQANSESTRIAVDGMKMQVASLQDSVSHLQTENAALKQQLAELQAAFEQNKTEQLKSRQTLIDNVAGMIADKGGKASLHKKEPVEKPDPSTPIKSTEVHADLHPVAPTLAPPPDHPAVASVKPPPAAPKQKGYNHVVAAGETLPMIVEAYRDSGVKVTAAQIRKANSLAPDSKLKPGQKLFIPKPGP